MRRRPGAASVGSSVSHAVGWPSAATPWRTIVVFPAPAVAHTPTTRCSSTRRASSSSSRGRASKRSDTTGMVTFASTRGTGSCRLAAIAENVSELVSRFAAARFASINARCDSVAVVRHPGGEGAPSVADRVFAVLESCAGSSHPLTLVDLVERTGLPKTTLHRMCWKLVELGMLEHAQDGFRIGTKLFALGSMNPGLRRLRAIAMPYLHTLVA